MEINFPTVYTIRDREDLDEVVKVLSALPLEIKTPYAIHIVSKNSGHCISGIDLSLSIDFHDERFRTEPYRELLNANYEIDDFYNAATDLDARTLDGMVKTLSEDAELVNEGESRLFCYFDGETLHRVYIDFENFPELPDDFDEVDDEE